MSTKPHKSKPGGPRRNIPSREERASTVPLEHRDDFPWSTFFHERLVHERPERIEQFVDSLNKHVDAWEAVLEDYESKSCLAASNFLLVLGELGHRLPDHFEDLAKMRPVPSWIDVPKTVFNTLRHHVEQKDSHFFEDIGHLLQSMPVDSYPEFRANLAEAISNGSRIFEESGALRNSRGRHPVRKLIVAIFDLFSLKHGRLPSIHEIRAVVESVVDRPPRQDEFKLALKALGLAAPVLEPGCVPNATR